MRMVTFARISRRGLSRLTITMDGSESELLLQEEVVKRSNIPIPSAIWSLSLSTASADVSEDGTSKTVVYGTERHQSL
jgi:hypothetical protein